MNAVQIRGHIGEVLASFKAPDLTKPETFVAHMVWLYHVIKASENLLKVAYANSRGDLEAYFMEHLEDERGHDKWLAEDLMSVGVDVSKTTVPKNAVEMAGSQYYLIHHVDAAALLGYMLVLECFPTALEYVSYLESVHGNQAIRTLRFHAEHDIAHGSELLEVIDRVEPWQRDLVFQSAMQTCVYLGAAIAMLP